VRKKDHFGLTFSLTFLPDFLLDLLSAVVPPNGSWQEFLLSLEKFLGKAALAFATAALSAAFLTAAALASFTALALLRSAEDYTDVGRGSA
jgi:hypothetical protein